MSFKEKIEELAKYKRAYEEKKKLTAICLGEELFPSTMHRVDRMERKVTRETLKVINKRRNELGLSALPAETTNTCCVISDLLMDMVSEYSYYFFIDEE